MNIKTGNTISKRTLSKYRVFKEEGDDLFAYKNSRFTVIYSKKAYDEAKESSDRIPVRLISSSK